LVTRITRVNTMYRGIMASLSGRLNLQYYTISITLAQADERNVNDVSSEINIWRIAVNISLPVLLSVNTRRVVLHVAIMSLRAD